MRFLLKTIMLAAVALTLAVAPASAQDAKAPLAIAVVDIQQLLKDSKAAQGIETQLATIRKNFQTEVEAEEKALRAAEKKIMDERASLSEEQLKTKAQDFQKQVQEGQKKIQAKKAKLDKAVATAIGKLRTEIVRVVADVGEKKNLDLVLARTDVVIVSKTLDITTEVLERINKDLPSVKVSVE